ncbi:MAG: hypothetical protein C0594_12065 [Marinilabiliales bacterium]|nr:MAG: hypothetical protein C0594_12065 [Marinilabiliales bacterium]
MKSIAILFFILFINISAIAQVPDAMKYQGIVRDENGDVLSNENVTFRFTIYDNNSGVSVYVEDHTITTNEFGLVNLEIGNGTVITGNFEDVQWGVNPGGNTYSLQVELDINGAGMNILGQAQFLSVPYAFHSRTADTAQYADFNNLINAPDYTNWDMNENDDFDGSYGSLVDTPSIPVYTSDLINNSGFITSANDADSDPNNELQSLSYVNDVLSISSGNSVVLPSVPVNVSDLNNDLGYISNPNDADPDPTNEIQNILYSNDTLYISGGNNAVINPGSLWMQNGNSIYYDDGNVGIGTVSPQNKLAIYGDGTNDLDTAIFAVHNSTGQLVFAVYEEGVRVYVDDEDGLKATGSKGGFAVGGFSLGKGITNEYLRVTPDSVRVYIDEANTTGQHNGGFAIGSFDASNPTEDIMHMSSENYFIGHESGIVATGQFNSFLGYQAGRALGSGNNNTGIGYQSLYNNTIGADNCGIGYQSLFANQGGQRNVAIGTNVLFSNVSGESNTAVGDQAMHDNIDGHYNSAIGRNALYKNQSGWSNSAMGDQALYNNTDGGSNVAIGVYAMYSNSTGNNNTAIGNMSFFNGLNYNNSTAVGYQALPNGSNQVRLGNTAVTSLYCSGAYAATTANSANMYVSSTGQIMRSTSSKRYKKDITDINIDTEAIYKLRPVSYRSINDNSQHFGLIAEEVAEVLPELAEYARKCDVVEGAKSKKLIPDAVQYPMLSVLLLNEIKKHKKTIDDQQVCIKELEKKIESLEGLKARISVLEESLQQSTHK